jgi:hypothetical protein
MAVLKEQAARLFARFLLWPTLLDFLGFLAA